MMIPARDLFKKLKNRQDQTLAYVFGAKTYPVILKRTARAKRLTLRVEPLGQIFLTVPMRCSDKRLRAFMAQHREWVRQQLDKALSPVPFAAGGTIPLRGEKHLVVHDRHQHGTVHKSEGTLAVSGDAAHLPRRLRDYLKKEAKKDFEKAVAVYAEKLGVKVRRIQIRDTRTRWGSCSSEGVLCFSWRLIYAPPFVLDYLAAHEVAHLRIMDHSPRFWKLVEQLCPDTPQARKWLKANGNMLLAIG